MNAPEHILPPDRGRRAPVNLMSDSQQDKLRDEMLKERGIKQGQAPKAPPRDVSEKSRAYNQARRDATTAATLRALGDNQLGAADVAIVLGYGTSSGGNVRDRLTDLCKRRLARVSGVDVSPHNNRKFRLFQITPEGRAWLAAQGGGE